MEDNIFDKVHEVDLKKTMETVLHRICHERYRIPCASGCKRWIKAGSATSALFHDRVK